MRRLFACVFLFAAPLVAQSRLVSGGAPAGATGPSFEASLGYVYFSMAMPAERVGLAGVDASGIVKFDSRLGLMVDSTYARTGNVFDTGHGANVLSFLAGPVFYPAVLKRFGIFVHALAGACRVDSAAPVGGNAYLQGWVARPSYAFGGGVEHSLVGSLAARVQADYQRTSFGDSAGTIQGQNDLRLTTSLVYQFRNREY
jgi:hypothetical protein